MEGQLIEKKIHIKVHSGLPNVNGDKERLVEVVQNMIDNACKFTGTQSCPMIEIGVEEKKRREYILR